MVVDVKKAMERQQDDTFVDEEADEGFITNTDSWSFVDDSSGPAGVNGNVF